MEDRAAAVFGLLFERGVDPAFVVHRERRTVVSANPRLADLLGVTPDDLVDRDVSALIVATDDQAPADIVAFAGHYEDVGLARGDGYPVFVTMTVTHVDHPVHGPMAACVARDMTIRRNLERDLFAKHSALFAAHADLERTVRQLRETQRELESSNREIAMLADQVSRFGRSAAIGELCAEIAHHLNNPVGALTSILRRLAVQVEQVDDPALHDDLAKLVGRGRDVTSRIESTINMIVRAQRTGVDAEPARWLVLGHVIDVALSTFGDRLLGIVVDRAYGQHDRAHVSHDALHHVLASLIDNSLHALDGGGTLRVAVEPRDDAFAIAVVDSGRGIPTAVGARLFEPIVNARVGGAGLGLSTAQRLARSWGGDVVHVPVSSGARFDVMIPMKRSA
jgi:PAS domain S-box-containing protein